MLDAALAYAARGWPVFPCSPESKRPLVTAVKGEPKGSGGLKRATLSEEVIRQWWSKWPDAMIGVPTGPSIGAFVLDIDAGADKQRGEIFDADAIIARLEKEVAELPETWTVETPRGGRHLYFATLFLDRIGNRADLLGNKSRIDVRGEGGYVIVPPSRRADGKAYHWMVKPQVGENPEPAPAELADCILRLGKWSRGARGEERSDREGKDANTVQPSKTPPPASASKPTSSSDHLHKYALSAFDAETRKAASAPDGARNATLNEAAFALGQLVGAGLLVEGTVRAALEEIAGQWPNFRKSQGTIDSGLRAGKAEPRSIADIEAKSSARSRASGRLSPSSRSGLRPSSPLAHEGEVVPPSPASDQLELRDILRQRRRHADPAPLEPRSGVRAGQWTPDRLGLPREDPCPVIPLGFDGELIWLLNSSGQLVGWTEQRFTHAGIQKLFAAAPHWPEWAYPRYGRARKITDPETGEETTFIPIESFKDDEVRKGIFRAIDRKGMFAPDQRIRGRGAWKRDDGSMLYHAGEELWIVEGGRIRAIETGTLTEQEARSGEAATGKVELVFPRMATLPPPWPKPVGPEDNPARALIEGFRKWNWDRPEIDPILFLGWIGVAYLGGALDWRSAVALVGDKGTGKSTLQDAVKAIFGDALFDRANTTAADIYQKLGHDTRPVAVDEMEASADNRNLMKVVELMRQASSGAFGGRGGSDSKGGVEIQMRSAFLFSAINTPPLLPQDLSRIAVLRLRDLDASQTTPPAIVDAETAGRKILTRLMLEWHRFPRTLEAYGAALAAGGHTGRGQATYGTLLAAADLILGPELADELGIPMVDDLSPWTTLLHVDTLPEVGDALPNWRACINHLFQSRVPAWRSGERATVGQLLDDMEKPFGLAGADGVSFSNARRQLAQAGLGISYEPKRGTILAVPNQSSLLEQLFFGSRWQGAPGAGGWSEALRQGPRDVCLYEAKGNRVRINGVQQRCTLVVLKTLDPDAPTPAPDHRSDWHTEDPDAVGQLREDLGGTEP